MRLCLIVSCCLIACLACNPALAQWTTYQGDASHDGYVPLSLDPATFSLLWQTGLSTNTLNPVAAANGEVFVSTGGYFSTGKALYALDAATGETIWSQDYGDVFSANPPAYANGKVYIQTCNHSPGTYLWAYDANTGDLVYRPPFSAQWGTYKAPTIYDNTVYIDGGYYGGMYAFDGSNGGQKWFAQLAQDDGWTPALDATYAYVYSGHYLTAINRKTGRVAFTINDPGNKWGDCLTVTLGTHNDAFALVEHRLICFDLKKRNVKWQSARVFAYSSQVTVANGVVYAIEGGALDAIDEISGKWLWSWVPPSGDLTGPIIATNTHVLASTADTTYAVDLNSHTTAWSYPLGGSLALSNRALYIAGSEGTLAAIAIPPSSIQPVPPSGLSIAISNPPSNPISVSDATACLSGTANELDSSGAVLGTGHLASVTWSNNRGGSGIGSYDSYWNAPTSWSVSGIALQAGDNVITVTVTDLWGNTATASTTITFVAPVGATISILSPTIKSTYSTNAIPVLSGTASAIYSSGASTGDTGLAYITWSNDNGDSGTCEGFSEWTATDLILAEGVNTINVTATDTMGNTASAAITITYIPSSPGYAWSGTAMVSMPIIPNNSDPKQVVGFRDNGWFAFISRNYVGYGNDPTHLSWFNDPTTCTPGRGFWAYFNYSSDESTPWGEVPDQSQPKTIHLSPGWNLIGNPFIKSVPWNRSAITVKDSSGVTRTLAQSNTVVKDYLWGWDSNRRSYYLVYDTSIIPTSRGTMEPWLGYWIIALAECDLIIPAP